MTTLKLKRFLRRLEHFIVLIVTCMFMTSVRLGMILDHHHEDLFGIPYESLSSSPTSRNENANIDATTLDHHDNIGVPSYDERSFPMLSFTKNTSKIFWNETEFPNLPEWMKEYFVWHDQVTKHLTRENWQNYNYLVLKCYRSDARCGGVSDRLKPLPLMVLAAAISKPQPRILYINWDRPCDLEEFLIPNKLQWSLPEWMKKEFQKQHYDTTSASKLSILRSQVLLDKSQMGTNATSFHVHIQDAQGGSQHYNSYLNQVGAFEKVYHDLFRFLFQPSPMLQHLINQKMKEQGLVAGKYSVAHYRAEYGKEIDRHPLLTKPVFLQKVTLNALKCASELQSSQSENNQKQNQVQKPIPIYFASDNGVALDYVRFIRQKYSYPIVTFDRAEATPLKLDDLFYQYHDKSTNTTMEIAAKPSDYYSTFVDLLIAGNGNCVTYGRGGFGRLASLLSYDSTCNIKHVEHFFPKECRGRPPFRDIPVPKKVGSSQQTS